MGVVEKIDSEDVSDVLAAALAHLVQQGGGELILTKEEITAASTNLKLKVSVSEMLGVIRFAVDEIAPTNDAPVGRVN